MSISAEDVLRRHEWVKYELRLRQLSFAKLAAAHNLDRSVFASVSAARKKSKRAATIIASCLDTSAELLWPEIYGDKDD